MCSRSQGSSKPPPGWGPERRRRPGSRAAASTRCATGSGASRGCSGARRPPQGPPPRFDLGLIQADADPVTLAECLVRDADRGFSLCLQGPPGTGKSAFARYLAERLGLEVLQKRASDLLSPWVGATEQQIAAAFAEARDAEAFLIFDEADSLLADRRSAHRSWEVSQVNEMLTWMETHPAPPASSTATEWRWKANAPHAAARFKQNGLRNPRRGSLGSVRIDRPEIHNHRLGGPSTPVSERDFLPQAIVHPSAGAESPNLSTESG